MLGVDLCTCLPPSLSVKKIRLNILKSYLTSFQSFRGKCQLYSQTYALAEVGRWLWRLSGVTPVLKGESS